jgi:hypothetical protein
MAEAEEVAGIFELGGQWKWTKPRYCVLRKSSGGYSLLTFADRSTSSLGKPQSERIVDGRGTRDVADRAQAKFKKHRFNVRLSTGKTLKLSAETSVVKAAWLAFLRPAGVGLPPAADAADDGDNAGDDGGAALEEHHRALIEQVGEAKFEEYKRAHAQCDADKDGTLNVDELAAAVAMLHFDVTRDRLEALIDKYDEDADGAVDI